MESLEYIDSYFNGELPAEETGKFEQKIIEDPDFASEVAYYLSASQALKEQSIENKKKEFREIYRQNKPVKPVGTIRKLWPSIAAAALVAGIIFGGYLFVRPVSTKQLADRYIQEQLQKLPILMGASQDSMQTAKNLFNNEQLPQALQYFQNLGSDTLNYEAREYAGITCLRLQYYDKALDYFKQVENYDLRVNPSLFNQALTLMKRNRPGDAKEAKKLLQQIVDKDLEGKATAEGWLKKF